MYRSPLLALLVLALAAPAAADGVRVENAWVRATAPGQKVAGGYMDLTADAHMRLVGGSSPVSAHLELHRMHMEGGVMVMRPLSEIPLPKGQTVSLKPGGLHIMFIDLKRPIREGDQVPIRLDLRDAAGKDLTLRIEARAMRGQGMGHAHH
ncbi:MAG TPA: copper chaperone PCu(A)C [Thiobacillaceae bacterium]|nr:copper chaperone PCu(A)C [Thiobacillaceae bacterium]HNU65272.1 copper chaperone PCu(A)C [Thiobacillaceae bacterium]